MLNPSILKWFMSHCRISDIEHLTWSSAEGWGELIFFIVQMLLQDRCWCDESLIELRKTISFLCVLPVKTVAVGRFTIGNKIGKEAKKKLNLMEIVHCISDNLADVKERKSLPLILRRWPRKHLIDSRTSWSSICCSDGRSMSDGILLLPVTWTEPLKPDPACT